MTELQQVEERTNIEPGQIVMPFYIVCDVSASMTGDMADLNAALGDLHDEVVSAPVVDDIARIGIITFSDDAQVVLPLGQMSEGGLPTLSAQAGTNYGAAFRTIAATIEADRQALKAQQLKIYRPCVFFLTDGEPLDGDYAQTFRDTLTKPATKAYPVFVPFGFRDAPEAVLRQLAYPPERGRWYMARTSSVREALKGVIHVIMTSIVTSGGRAASSSAGALALADPAPGVSITAGDSEFMD
ncbi:MAG: VWA domain-containing protein [Solirubrobacteraceae bacterium]|nr:VWA domain-containing protein [Solirubrobacteraceae bacterium]